MDREAITSAIDLVNRYLDDPQKAITEWYQQAHSPLRDVQKSQLEITKRLETLSKTHRVSVDHLSERFLHRNRNLIAQIPTTVFDHDHSIQSMLLPVERVGIAIRNRHPSQLMAYLAAVRAANTPQVVAYIIHEEQEELDPLTCYLCQKFGVHMLGGPAQFSFPVLAFGFEKAEGCQFIAGACDRKLAALKHVSTLLSGCACEMSTYQPTLAILLEDPIYCEQAVKDINAYLEHATDSSACLYVIGSKLIEWTILSGCFSELTGNSSVSVHQEAELTRAVTEINALSPESLEIYSTRADAILREIKSASTVYLNRPQSLGSYTAIGRGSIISSNESANAVRSISPLDFMRLMPAIHGNEIDVKDLTSAQTLAIYEGMEHDSAAIEHFHRLVNTYVKPIIKK